MSYLKKNIYRIVCALKYRYFSVISRNLFKININKWFFLDGNKNFLIKHKLDKNSIVFEVGGYTGVFADRIIAAYDPYMYIFEPIEEYYNMLCTKYSNNKKIKIFCFGLSDKDTTISIGKSNDGSSVFRQGSAKEEILLKDIYMFLKAENLVDSKIDLISINIEGGEYQLLQRILDTTPDVFAGVQVQFHDFVEDAYAKRTSLLSALSEKGYSAGYSFPFVWEFFKK